MLRDLKVAALSLVAGFVVTASVTASAAPQDGNWSVVVITEKGACDRAYRYSVAVANGQVRYQGDTAVNFNGTIDPNGTVKVAIRLGEKGANGTGRLSKDSGLGTWQGFGNAGECAGHWEAERR